jgi:hypothetical protein
MFRRNDYMPPPQKLPNDELINVKDLHLVHEDGTVYAVSLADLIAEAAAASTSFAVSGYVTVGNANIIENSVNNYTTQYDGTWVISINSGLRPRIGTLVRDSSSTLQSFVGRIIAVNTESNGNIPIKFTIFSFADKWTDSGRPDWSARNFTWNPSVEA